MQYNLTGVRLYKVQTAAVVWVDAGLERMKKEKTAKLKFMEELRLARVKKDEKKALELVAELGACQRGQRGFVLAHHMGLGKTVTTLGVVTTLMTESEGVVLLVVPLSLMEQWRGEIAQRTNVPEDAVAEYRGEWRQQVLEFGVADGHGAARWHVRRSLRMVLVTPGTLASEWKDFEVGRGELDEAGLSRAVHDRHHNGRGALFWEKPLCTVVDEAHVIRNSATKTSRAVARLRPKLWLMLTGTPFGKTSN